MNNFANIQTYKFPPFYSEHSNAFFRQIERNFHAALRYGCEEVRRKARQLIPNNLESKALIQLNKVEANFKNKNMSMPNISIQDFLILELLEWFKEEFFTWVSSPNCSKCGAESKFSHMAKDTAGFPHTERVELHLCTVCKNLTPFPRYNDLNILLETRKGRCGEWANTFTLFCISMAWDARMIFDETDHVWTEVYSIKQKRWLHCDACENICDKPLIYEFGWKKPISYVLAYSNEEVQDVTWRYTSNFKETLKRRTKCNENDLVKILIELRKRRQISLSETKRQYLTERVLNELAEFLIEKKPSSDDQKGRQSGDLEWRLARGETEEEISIKYIWKINLDRANDTSIAYVRYSAALDVYQLFEGNNLKDDETPKSWSAGCFSHENLRRNLEKDWKQVYIARKNSDSVGKIIWSFEFPGSLKKLDTITLKFTGAVYETGLIETKICSKELIEIIPMGLENEPYCTKKFKNVSKLTIEAFLSGGKGDLAWQHAQLFRQPIDSKSFPFNVKFTFSSNH